MERIGPELFKCLADFAVLLDGGRQIRLTDVDVVLFDAVDQNLNGEVLPAELFDAADDLTDKSCAVFKTLRTVFVVAVISLTGEKGLADVVAGSVDLDRIEAQILHFLCALDEVFLDQLDFFPRQMLGKSRSILRCGGSVKAAEGTAHAAELIADIPARFVNAVNDSLDMGVLDLHGAAAREIISERKEVFHPDHFHAALCESSIVFNRFLFTAFLGIGACRGFHHAVIQRQPAEFPRAENRGKVRVRIAEIIILRVQLRHGLIYVYRGLRCFLPLGKGDRAQNACRRDPECAGRRTFQKITS